MKNNYMKKSNSYENSRINQSNISDDSSIQIIKSENVINLTEENELKGNKASKCLFKKPEKKHLTKSNSNTDKGFITDGNLKKKDPKYQALQRTKIEPKNTFNKQEIIKTAADKLNEQKKSEKERQNKKKEYAKQLQQTNLILNNNNNNNNNISEPKINNYVNKTMNNIPFNNNYNYSGTKNTNNNINIPNSTFNPNNLNYQNNLNPYIPNQIHAKKNNSFSSSNSTNKKHESSFDKRQNYKVTQPIPKPKKTINEDSVQNNTTNNNNNNSSFENENRQEMIEKLLQNYQNQAIYEVQKDVNQNNEKNSKQLTKKIEILSNQGIQVEVTDLDLDDDEENQNDEIEEEEINEEQEKAETKTSLSNNNIHNSNSNEIVDNLHTENYDENINNININNNSNNNINNSQPKSKKKSSSDNDNSVITNSKKTEKNEHDPDTSNPIPTNQNTKYYKKKMKFSNNNSSYTTTHANNNISNVSKNRNPKVDPNEYMQHIKKYKRTYIDDEDNSEIGTDNKLNESHDSFRRSHSKKPKKKNKKKDYNNTGYNAYNYNDSYNNSNNYNKKSRPVATPSVRQFLKRKRINDLNKKTRELEMKREKDLQNYYFLSQLEEGIQSKQRNKSAPGSTGINNSNTNTKRRNTKKGMVPNEMYTGKRKVTNNLKRSLSSLTNSTNIDQNEYLSDIIDVQRIICRNENDEEEEEVNQNGDQVEGENEGDNEEGNEADKPNYDSNQFNVNDNDNVNNNQEQINKKEYDDFIASQENEIKNVSNYNNYNNFNNQNNINNNTGITNNTNTNNNLTNFANADSSGHTNNFSNFSYNTNTNTNTYNNTGLYLNNNNNINNNNNNNISYNHSNNNSNSSYSYKISNVNRNKINQTMKIADEVQQSEKIKEIMGMDSKENVDVLISNSIKVTESNNQIGNFNLSRSGTNSVKSLSQSRYENENEFNERNNNEGIEGNDEDIYETRIKSKTENNEDVQKSNDDRGDQMGNNMISNDFNDEGDDGNQVASIQVPSTIHQSNLESLNVINNNIVDNNNNKINSNIDSNSNININNNINVNNILNNKPNNQSDYEEENINNINNNNTPFTNNQNIKTDQNKIDKEVKENSNINSINSISSINSIKQNQNNQINSLPNQVRNQIEDDDDDNEEEQEPAFINKNNNPSNEKNAIISNLQDNTSPQLSSDTINNELQNKLSYLNSTIKSIYLYEMFFKIKSLKYLNGIFYLIHIFKLFPFQMIISYVNKLFYSCILKTFYAPYLRNVFNILIERANTHKAFENAILILELFFKYKFLQNLLFYNEMKDVEKQEKILELFQLMENQLLRNYFNKIKSLTIDNNNKINSNINLYNNNNINKNNIQNTINDNSKSIGGSSSSYYDKRIGTEKLDNNSNNQSNNISKNKNIDSQSYSLSNDDDGLIIKSNNNRDNVIDISGSKSQVQTIKLESLNSGNNTNRNNKMNKTFCDSLSETDSILTDNSYLSEFDNKSKPIKMKKKLNEIFKEKTNVKLKLTDLNKNKLNINNINNNISDNPNTINTNNSNNSINLTNQNSQNSQNNIIAKKLKNNININIPKGLNSSQKSIDSQNNTLNDQDISADRDTSNLGIDWELTVSGNKSTSNRDNLLNNSKSLVNSISSINNNNDIKTSIKNLDNEFNNCSNNNNNNNSYARPPINRNNLKLNNVDNTNNNNYSNYKNNVKKSNNTNSNNNTNNDKDYSEDITYGDFNDDIDFANESNNINNNDIVKELQNENMCNNNGLIKSRNEGEGNKEIINISEINKGGNKDDGDDDIIIGDVNKKNDIMDIDSGTGTLKEEVLNKVINDNVNNTNNKSNKSIEDDTNNNNKRNDNIGLDIKLTNNSNDRYANISFGNSSKENSARSSSVNNDNSLSNNQISPSLNQNENKSIDKNKPNDKIINNLNSSNSSIKDQPSNSTPNKIPQSTQVPSQSQQKNSPGTNPNTSSNSSLTKQSIIKNLESLSTMEESKKQQSNQEQEKLQKTLLDNYINSNKESIAESISNTLLSTLLSEEISSNDKFLPRKTNRPIDPSSSLMVSMSSSIGGFSPKRSSSFNRNNENMNDICANNLNSNSNSFNELNNSIFMKTIKEIKKDKKINFYNEFISKKLIDNIINQVDINYNQIVDKLKVPYKYVPSDLVNRIMLRDDSINKQTLDKFNNYNTISKDVFIDKEKTLNDFNKINTEIRTKENNTPDIIDKSIYYDKILNECYIDAANEIIGRERMYGELGEPLPWSVRTREVEFCYEKNDQLHKKKLLNFVKDKMNYYADLKMGLIPENYEYLEPEQIGLDRDKKFIESMKEELQNGEEKYKNFETEETHIKLILSKIILDQLLNEIVEILEHVQLSRREPAKYQSKSIYACEDIPRLSFQMTTENMVTNDNIDSMNQ